MSPQRRQTLAATGAENLIAAGEPTPKALWHAAQACSHLWALAMTMQHLERFPTQVEYAERWGLDERTAQRHWAGIRRAWPGEETPERLTRWILSEASNRLNKRSEALNVTAPPDAVLA